MGKPKKITMGLVLMSLMVINIPELGAQPGSSDDPFVTKSYVDQKVNQDFGGLQEDLETLEQVFSNLDQRTKVIAEAVGPFKDIKNHWAANEILFLNDKGIVGGFPDGTFKPKETVTRAQMASMLVRATGLEKVTQDSDFTDVSNKHWARVDIATAKANGIIGGYSDSTFKPSQPVTRQEIASMIGRAFSIAAGQKTVELSDIETSWAKQSIQTLASAGVLGGYPDGTFRPKQTANRAEVSVILTRAIEPSKRNTN